MNQVKDQRELLISELYPNFYTHDLVPETGETTKTRRRRRKRSKGEGDGKGEKKRKLTDEQVNMLEVSFGNDHKLETERKDKLAMELGLDPRQVAVWFQNRRARWKNQKLDEEYSKLKKAYDSVVVEKCHLENQVLQLKEQLTEAEKEINKLSEHLDRISTSSLRSLSIDDANQQQFLGEFMVEGFDSPFYVPDYDSIYDMGWVNLFDYN